MKQNDMTRNNAGVVLVGFKSTEDGSELRISNVGVGVGIGVIYFKSESLES